MAHCYKYLIESTEVVHQLVGGSSDSSFQLNERQCQILAKELVETKAFLERRGTCLNFGEGVGGISLQHLCSTVKRAEDLVKKCCCKDLESWLVSAMMLVEIQEEFVMIILDIHLWRMFLDFAIACGRGLSQEQKIEEMKIMDDKYHQLFRDLRRESHTLQQAVVEDKKTIISETSRIANLYGSTNGLDYQRAIYLQSWLTNSATCRNVDLKKCEYLHLLGQGGCGAVMKVKWLGVECALKMLRGQDEKESIALKGLFHPNIIRLFHYWEDCPEKPQSRLLMELMPQDLGAYMVDMSSSKTQIGKENMPFSLPVAIDIMYQIAQAMRYMHEKHLIHRDLKPANILVKERLQVGLTCIDNARYLDIKLADFGLVKSYNNTSTFQTQSRNKGTGMYRAPEIFGKDMTEKRHYLPMADVWSFGITCAEILSGKKAYGEYGDESPSELQTLICKEGLRPTLPKHCPPYLAFCIKSCWELLPFHRPTFASLCKLLRHAKLLSLGAMKLDDSKFFFAYTTRNDQVKSLDLAPSPSGARVSTFFQSSLRLMGIRPRRAPSAAEAVTMYKVRLVAAPLNTEDNPELHEDIGGGLATPGSLGDGERHYSAILPAAEIVHEERVVSTPIVTEESPPRMANEDVAGSVAALGSPSQRVKSLPDLQEPAELTQASLDNAISPPDASDSIQPAVTLRLVHSPGVMSATKSDGGNFARDCEVEDEVELTPSGNPPPWNLAEICNIKEVRQDVAGSVAALGSPSQRVKSLSDLQEPAELTQASLDNAISPPGASDSIQPAIILWEKLGRAILKTEMVSPSQNRPPNHSQQKNQKPRNPFSQIIQDILEGKSAEPELPKFRKAPSASNSLSALSWNQNITLPKPSPPADPEVIQRFTASSSSSRGDHNNASEEANDYEFRAPPPGSYQDDDTRQPPFDFLVAVMEVKSVVHHFAEILQTDMQKHPVELEYLKQKILKEVRADMDRANYWKFLVQAFICKRLFNGFNAPNGYFGPLQRLLCYAEFSTFQDKVSTISTFEDKVSAIISMLQDSDSSDASFLGRFCFKKFKSIISDLASPQPLPIYQEEWDAIMTEHHPRTKFYQSFLKAAVSVWFLHRLKETSEGKVKMLIYGKGAKFQGQTMESIVDKSLGAIEDEESDVELEVDFLVFPGFQVSRSVVKCIVYLRSRNRHTDMEITGRASTEEAPMKTPSDKPPGTTLSVKTFVKPHTPEVPVRDNNSVGRLQPCEGCGSSLHYGDHVYPTRALEMTEAEALHSGRQARIGTLVEASLSPGNQGSSASQSRASSILRKFFQF